MFIYLHERFIVFFSWRVSLSMFIYWQSLLTGKWVIVIKMFSEQKQTQTNNNSYIHVIQRTGWYTSSFKYVDTLSLNAPIK